MGGVPGKSLPVIWESGAKCPGKVGHNAPFMHYARIEGFDGHECSPLAIPSYPLYTLIMTHTRQAPVINNPWRIHICTRRTLS